jgi:hypothetical protein
LGNQNTSELILEKGTTASSSALGISANTDIFSVACANSRNLLLARANPGTGSVVACANIDPA